MTIEVRWGSATHVGCVRTVNQDAVLTGPVVFAVADGMGGHAAGEVASAITLARMAALPLGASGEEVLAAVRDANAEVMASGSPGSGREGMGTTLSGIAFATRDDDEALLVFNVGDSRTYLLDSEGISQLTTDHSLVAEMVRAGELDAADARSHRARNVVTRAIGIEAVVRTDHWWIQPQQGQMFLICSDGLSNEVAPEQMEVVLRSMATPQAAVDQLVDLALDAGAKDNVSAVVVVVDAVTVDESKVEDDTNPRAPRADGPTADDGRLIDAVPGGSSGMAGGDSATSPTPLVTGVPSTSEQSS